MHVVSGSVLGGEISVSFRGRYAPRVVEAKSPLHRERKNPLIISIALWLCLISF
jgi:hypothetical protein